MFRIITIFLISLSFGVLHAQTLHGIIMADTDDAYIGAGCTTDIKLMNNQFEKIAEGIGYKLKITVLTKETFTMEALYETIRNVDCKPDDIIFFYYTGHGYNLSDRSSSYPLIQIKKQKDQLRSNPALDDIHAEICKKGGKFGITIGDCCNNVITAPLPNTRDVIAKVPRLTNDFYRKLFLENKGNVLITSARPPQFSPTHPQIGSLYTVAFTQAMTYGEAYNTKGVTWQQLLNDTDNRLQSIRNDFKPSNPEMANQAQIPIFSINIEQAAASENPVALESGKESPEKVSAPVASIEQANTLQTLDYDRVNRYLNNLVDENLSEKERSKLYKGWPEYFVAHAPVDVYVNTTLVEKQPIEAAIEQLYLNAALIRNVNFISDLSKASADGKKYVQIAIQQIRR